VRTCISEDLRDRVDEELRHFNEAFAAAEHRRQRRFVARCSLLCRLGIGGGSIAPAFYSSAGVRLAFLCGE
jgi:hypothetical protein